MSFLLKDPDASLDYAVDWGAEYLAGDALVSSSWAVSPEEPGGVMVVGSDYDLLVSTVQVAGGEAGKTYRLSNRVMTTSGRRDTRSVVLRVEKR